MSPSFPIAKLARNVALPIGKILSVACFFFPLYQAFFWVQNQNMKEFLKKKSQKLTVS